MRCLATAILAVLSASLGASAQSPVNELPREFDGAGIEERLDATLPLHLKLRNEQGETVALGDYFDGDDRPVILTPVYFRCPQLCTLTLNGLVNGLNEIEWTAGREFRIVTFSFNPDETVELADVKKRAYLNQYSRPEVASGWNFHVADEETIKELCDAIGFGFRRDERSGDYAHAAAIVFCTPDGRISRYMNDVVYEPRDLRLALIEASEGAIGSPMEKFVLFMCYRYDPDANSYVASAWKIMRLGGIVTVIVVGAGLTILFLKGPRRAAAHRTAVTDS